MEIKRVLPDGPLTAVGTARAKAQLEGAVGNNQAFLEEIHGICSLIFLKDAYQIKSAHDAGDAIKNACKTQRGFGQVLIYAFHPKLYPEVTGFLIEAGWKKLCEWPSGHPGDNPMELWGVLTGQEPH